MIIKSLSRKRPSFEQLVNYMEKEKGHRAIYHNFFGSDSMSREEIIFEFMENSRELPKRKNGNYLYHEIISFEARHELSPKKVDEILIEIGEMYLQERATKQLAFSNIHLDTNHIHMHFCISANEVGSSKRKRLDKAKFAKIQKNLELYVLEKYPELKQSIIYNKSLDKEKMKTTAKEQEQKKRTGKISKKEEIKNKFHGIFEQAKTIDELKNLLSQEGFTIYQRGQTIGIVCSENKRKYRLKTLGLLPHYEALKSRLTADPAKDIEAIRKDELKNVLGKQKDHKKER